MKQMFFMIGSAMLKQFLSGPMASAGVAMAGTSLVEPLRELVKENVKRYALTAALALLFSMYFVAGTALMIAAAAQSFDSFSRFVPTVLFYSGSGITLISLLALGLCYRSFKKIAPAESAKHEVLPEAPAHPHHPEFHIMQIVEPILSGVIAGLVTRKMTKKEPRPLLRRII